MNIFDQRPRWRIIISLLVVLALYGLTVLIEMIGSNEGSSIRLLWKCVLILIKDLVLNHIDLFRQ